MHFQRAVAFLACIFLTLSACAKPLEEKTSDEFSRLATSAASLVGKPAETQIIALSEANKNERLCSYLSGNSFTLGVPSSPIRATPLAQQQAVAGAALDRYVKSLISASRGDSITKLTAAENQLKAAVTGFAQEAGNEQSGSIFNSSLTLASRIGEPRRQTMVRSAMRDAIDPLFILEALLKRDAQEVTQETRKAVAAWDKAALCVLQHRRNSSDSSSLFNTFDERRAVLTEQLALIERAPEAVEKLRVAHILAVTEPGSFEAAIAEVVSVLQELEALQSAIEG